MPDVIGCGPMNENIGHESGHPAGEPETALVPVASEEEELVIDTPGGRYRASFDERTPVSPLGPLCFSRSSCKRAAGSRGYARTRRWRMAVRTPTRRAR